MPENKYTVLADLKSQNPPPVFEIMNWFLFFFPVYVKPLKHLWSFFIKFLHETWIVISLISSGEKSQEDPVWQSMKH